MTKSEFLTELQEMLQIDSSLQGDTSLEDLEEWDSMAVMILIAFYDRMFGFKFQYDDVQSCKTPDDLVRLAGDKIE